MGTMSGCRQLKVNLKAKIFKYVNSTTQRCPNKIIKIFLIEDFLIHEKNKKSKISWHCPFKGTTLALTFFVMNYEHTVQYLYTICKCNA
jgi:hypothetical protein